MQNPRFFYYLFLDKTKRKIYGIVHFSSKCEGTPRVCHGGAIFMLFDCLFCEFVHKIFDPSRTLHFTLSLEVQLKIQIPIDSTLLFEGEFNSKSEKITEFTGKLFKDESIFCISSAFFFQKVYLNNFNFNSRINSDLTNQLPSPSSEAIEWYKLMKKKPEFKELLPLHLDSNVRLLKES